MSSKQSKTAAQNGNSATLLRAGLLCTVAAGVLFVAQPNRAHAVCVTSGNIATCTGDEQDGIQSGTDFPVPTVDTLNVNNLDAPGIAPPSTFDGINFTAGVAQDFTINADTSGTDGIATNGSSARGIIAYQAAGAGNLSVTTTGDITTAGQNSQGVFLYNSGGNGDMTINFVGSIHTTERQSDGLNAQQRGGDGNLNITSVGRIKTEGDSGGGIRAELSVGNGNVSITSTGNIITLGEGSDGLKARNFAGDGDISVSSVGNISTSDNFTEGIVAEQTGGEGDVTIVSVGKVSTMGETSEAIYAEVANGNGDIHITSTGDIATDGASSQGILAYNYGVVGNITINSIGDITAKQKNSQGIYAEIYIGGEGDITISSKGTLSSIERQSEGIEARHDGGNGKISITSVGDISTQGDSGGGIQGTKSAGNGDVSIVSKGDISTMGEGSDGLHARNFGGTGNISIVSRGDILTTNIFSEGIMAEQDFGDGDVTIDSKGKVIAEQTIAIRAGADGVGEININQRGGPVSGTTGISIVKRDLMAAATIKLGSSVTGTDGTAIDFQWDGDDVLNLKGGSAIIGTIDFGNSNVTDFDTLKAMPGFNGEISFADSGSAGQGDTDLQSAPEMVGANIAVVNGGLTAAVLDSTGFAASSVFLGSLTSSVSNSLNNARFAPSQEQSAQDELESYVTGSGPHFWLTGFGGSQQVEAGADNAGLEHRFGGLIFGAEKNTEMGTHGLFGGLGLSELDLEFDAGEVEVGSIFGGAYWKQDYGTHRIKMAFVGGMANHESKRNVTGTVPAIAEGDYTGWFFSPSVTLAAPLQWQEVKVIASMRASYSGMFLDGYTETGSVANPFTVSDRYVHIFNARAQLALPQVMHNEQGYRTVIEWRAGLDGQVDAGSENVGASTGAAAIDFSAALDEQIAGFVGASLTMLHPERNLALTASGEFQSAFNGGQNAAGEIRASIQF